jgi:hypothetical protein
MSFREMTMFRRTRIKGSNLRGLPGCLGIQFIDFGFPGRRSVQQEMLGQATTFAAAPLGGGRYVRGDLGGKDVDTDAQISGGFILAKEKWPEWQVGRWRTPINHHQRPS